MRRLLVLLLAGLLVAAGLAASGFAQEKKAPGAAKQAGAAKQGEFQWNGTITRLSLEKKALEVKHHTQALTRTVLFTDQTSWTEGTKAVGVPKLKEGMHIIARGKLNDKGQVEATRIDIRAQ